MVFKFPPTPRNCWTSCFNSSTSSGVTLGRTFPFNANSRISDARGIPLFCSASFRTASSAAVNLTVTENSRHSSGGFLGRPPLLCLLSLRMVAITVFGTRKHKLASLLKPQIVFTRLCREIVVTFLIFSAFVTFCENVNIVNNVENITIFSRIGHGPPR